MTEPALADRPDGPVRWCRLGNVPLSLVSLAEAADRIGAWAGRPPFRLVVTPNVDHVMRLQRDAAFRAAYERADLSLIDGVPLLWAMRYLGLPRATRVCGTDLVEALCRRGQSAGWRVFVAGGDSESQLADALAAVARRFAPLEVGGHCPPRGFERDEQAGEALLAAIERFEPDLLLLACGAPKSEVWMDRHRDRLARGVGLGVGAAVSYLAGVRRRAPRLMQRAGLEWLWRLAAEPGRLARRYLLDDMRFFPLVWRWKRGR